MSTREAELMQDVARLDEALKERVRAEGKREVEVEEAWGRVDVLLKLLDGQKKDHQRERERFEAVIGNLGKQLEAAQSQVMMTVREIENKQMATTALLTQLIDLIAGLPNTLTPIEIRPPSPSAPPSSPSPAHAPPKSPTPAPPPTQPSKPGLQEGKLVFSIPAGGVSGSSLAPPPPKPPQPTQPAWTPIGSSSSTNKTTTKNNNGKEQQGKLAIDRDMILLPLDGMTPKHRKRIRKRVRDAKEEDVAKVVEEIWNRHGGAWAVKGKGKVKA
ncbi:hypothetical protein EX30DRAFT_341849 [Ascodesmis nigricans]|uniref:Uncharacterized protein n=1 Tax=Ascodesmis nigricans TaxID=341454 RepID=A0A4S2MTZ0_9PEZI|nr:hypothetical protein EX30DRAFT_341849 [Ascodesmis nigricans]